MLTKREAGSRGGRATVRKHGRAHMQAIGRRGAKTLWARYKLGKVGTSGFALVDRQTNVIVALTGFKGR